MLTLCRLEISHVSFEQLKLHRLKLHCILWWGAIQKPSYPTRSGHVPLPFTSKRPLFPYVVLSDTLRKTPQLREGYVYIQEII